MGRNRSWSWCAAVLACAALVVVLRADGLSAVHAVPRTTIGGVTFAHHIVERGEVTAYFGFDTEQREIEVLWSFGAGGFVGDGISCESQRWQLDYWPTDIAPISNGRWLVSGKDPATAETIVECWEFAQDAWANVEQLGNADPVTGRADCRWQLPQRELVTELYREATPGRDVVECCMQMPGRPRCALVRFQDSKDIYELDLETQCYALVASPSLAGARLRAPRTGNSIDYVWWARLESGGVVLVIEPAGELCGQWLRFRSRTVLFDADENGVFDSASELTWEQWARSEWSDPACHIETSR